MYHTMTNEAGGLSLPSRFMAYNQYLGCLRDLLVRCGVLPTIDVAHMLTFDHRSPNFDLNLLEKLRRQILRLRDARGIRKLAATCASRVPFPLTASAYRL